MRITQLSTFNGFLDRLKENRSAIADLQEQLTTGKRVVRPSDDNVAFGTSRKLKESLRKNRQYQRNIKTGLSQARNSQQALEGMVDLMIDFKTSTVNGANDTLSDKDREILADKLAGYKEKMMELANTQFNDTYLFGGTHSNLVPFTEDGTATGGIDDNSSYKPLKIRISENSEIETTITGKELRNSSAGDIFGVMDTVEAALRANDAVAVGNTLQDVEEVLDHVTRLASKIGGNINQMDFAYSKLEERNIGQKGEISRLTESDYAETVAKFKKHETSYKAAMTVHSRISQMSLLNYI